jgi:WD40 repeat protein
LNKRGPTDPLADELALGVTVTHTESVQDTSETPDDPSSATRYVVRGEFARGGIGRILTAHDERLNRAVAIKEPLQATGSAAQFGRFRREAAITARLQHPAIVPVYDAGMGTEGRPYYVMKLLSNGRTLKQVVGEAAGLAARMALLPNVIAVADAIAYAHSVGIIHRDIKPSNVILGPFGETVVIDWGLAKDLDAQAPADETVTAPYRVETGELTSAGAVVGTACYMPPEQARGESIDPRADVYALGALLYHVLDGAPPFNGLDARDVINRVAAEHSPEPLSRRQPLIPPDLIAIVQKAMSPARSSRYESAEALTDDLKRFQAGQRVHAHDYSIGALLLRSIRKHKLVSAVATGFALLLAVTLTVSIGRINHERGAAVVERNRLILAQARSSLDSDPTLAVAWLKTYPRDGIDWNRAQTLAADAASRGIAHHLLPTMSQSVTLFADGKRVVTGGPDQLVNVWDLASGRLLRSATFSGAVSSVRIAPDGDTLAVSQQRGEIVLWRLRDDSRVVLGKHDGGAFRLAFAPDGLRLASAGQRSLAVWSLSSGRQEASLPSGESLTTMAYEPDGKAIGFGTANGAVKVWQPESGRVRTLVGHVGAVNSLVFSPDGRLISTGGNDHTVRVWDVAGGDGRVVGAHDDVVRIVEFSPEGRRIASGGVDHKVRLWSLDGKPARAFDGHTDVVNDVRFSPDGSLLASCGPDRQVRVWELATGEARVFRGHGGDLGDVLFTGDGLRLISTGYDQNTRLWDVVPEPGRIIGRHRVEAVQAVFSFDDKLVLSVGTERLVRLWDLSSGQERLLPDAEYSARGNMGTLLALSPNGQMVASAGEGAAHIWRLDTGETRVFRINRALPRSVSFSADSGALAAATSEGNIRLWDLVTNQERLLSGHIGDVLSVQFSPTEPVLVSIGLDRSVRLWNISLGSGRIVGAVASEATTRPVFAPDGHRFATGTVSGEIYLWDLSTQALRTLRGHDAEVSALVFSHDGQLLVSSSWDHTARVWNLATGEVRTLRSHEEPVRSVAISKDGRMVATASNDRTIRLWNLENGGMAILRGHRAVVRSVRFSSDGSKLVSASEDATVRLWSMSRIHFVPRDRTALADWLAQQTSATLPRPANEQQ